MFLLWKKIPTWHGSVKLTDEDISIALKELGYSKEEIAEVLNGKST
jgi:Holliday junction resolvasome RuvABC DNA-binding subunit